MSLKMTEKKTRLLCEDDVIKAVDKHTNDDGSLDDDISCILEEVEDYRDKIAYKNDSKLPNIPIYNVKELKSNGLWNHLEPRNQTLFTSKMCP